MPNAEPDPTRTLAPGRSVLGSLARTLSGVAIVGAAWSGQAQAQERASGWTVEGSVRTRYEVIEGQARAGFNADDDLLNVRTRLLAAYDGGVWRFGGELYDSRVDLENPRTPVTTGEVNTLEFVQAYVGADVSPAWAGGVELGVQAGRFTLNLGSRRLVAADDYRNTANGYTGLRLDARGEDGANVTLVYVLPQQRRPDRLADLRDNAVALDRENGDLRLAGAVASWPVGIERAFLQPSFFRLEERDQPNFATRDRRLNTVALRYFRDPAAGSLDVDVEVIGQSGEISASAAPTAAKLDVSAHYVHAETGFTFDHPWRPRFGVEIDYASGDKPGGDYGRFDTLFGMRRAELAPAGLYNAVGRANLAALGVRAEVQPSRRWDAFVAWRTLSLASRFDSFSTTGVIDPTGAAGRSAGQQIDARLRYWLIPERLRVETNVVHLAKGRFFDDAPNSPHSGDTTYAAFDVTVSF